MASVSAISHVHHLNCANHWHGSIRPQIMSMIRRGDAGGTSPYLMTRKRGPLLGREGKCQWMGCLHVLHVVHARGGKMIIRLKPVEARTSLSNVMIMLNHKGCDIDSRSGGLGRKSCGL